MAEASLFRFYTTRYGICHNLNRKKKRISNQ